MLARSRFRWLQRGLLTLGLAALALWTRDLVASRSFQANASTRLDAAIVASALARTQPVGTMNVLAPIAVPGAGRRTPPATGSVLGRLEIPRLAISAVVAEGVDLKTLGRAVGHVSSTALPGSRGNCALAGHRDTFLRGLGAVRVNDVIRLVTPERTFTYRVEWTEIVQPTRVDVLDPTTAPSLTLVTCFPFRLVGHAKHRFIVRASLLDPQGPHASL